MAEPETASRQQRYEELLQQIGAALIGAAPDGWRRIDLIAKIAKGVQDFGLTVIMSDLSDAEIDPPAQTAQALVELRDLMYDADRGAWLSARYVLNPPGEFRIFYNYEHDPLWDPPIPSTVFRRDLETYPRPAEQVPGWLRRTRPTPLGFEDQRDLTRKIADLLVLRAPADRDQIRVVYRAAGNHEEMVGHILGIDGRLRNWETPRELADFFRQLRAGMYKDGVGTWTAASLVVEYPIRTSINYLFEEDPRWRQPPPGAAVREELEMFPRTPENVPDWMKAVLPDAERVAAEIPALRPQQGPVPPPAPPPSAPPEMSARERQVLAIIERQVSEAGVIPQAYRILDWVEGATCLERVGEQWQVAYYERGKPRNPQLFTQLWDAGAYLLGNLTIHPSSLRAGGTDQNTARALNDWPIQPLPGEPPLTLLNAKHVAVLMPGRELVRYGPPAGNLTFAAGTEFKAMSLKPEREQQGPHHYRVIRELRTLSGWTVPWHGQPGGGVAYLLPKSVTEHLADGSMTELPRNASSRRHNL